MATSEKKEEVERREVRLTEKGLALFETQCEQYRKAMEKPWTQIEDTIFSLQDSQSDIKALRTLDKELDSAYELFAECVDNYVTFLKRSNSEQAKEKERHLNTQFTKCKHIVENAKIEISTLRMNLVETLSQVSFTTSERKKRDERKKEFLQKEADLQKKKLQIEAEELALKAETIRKKGELEIDIKLLKQQNSDHEDFDEDVSFDLPIENKSDRTAGFVRNLSVDSLTPSVILHEDINVTPVPNNVVPQPTSYLTTNDNTSDRHHHSDNDKRDSTSDNQNLLADLSSFLMRKQLIPERFSSFNDEAESYNAWKSSFRSIATELKVPKHEEIELLLNKLTGKSKEVASSIRNANPGNAERAVRLVWERLNEMYGRPEMIEASVRRQLENFRVVTVNEPARLYDLLNILIKIECLKENAEFAQSLAYYDSSTGVNPILVKLPYNIQDKWVFRAASYKKKYGVPFPPFTVFVEFVREMCEIKNDPAFSFNRAVSVDKRGQGQRRSTLQVHSRKSEVSDNTQNRCPYHKANHGIQECDGFRNKPYSERKYFLLSKHLCLRCCVSTNHIARDCTARLRCGSCGSVTHSSAMHIDKPQQRFSPHGGESTQSSTYVKSVSTVPKDETPKSSEVSTKCTTLCGDSFKARSCSKTVLVNVSLNSEPEKSIRVYAILDDQSDQTLASSDLFDAMNISNSPEKYTLTSCSGSVTMFGRRARGLVVSAIGGSTSFDLPTVIECDDIPNEKSEIPTPEVARSYPHLRDIAPLIPDFDSGVDVQLLIGRDLLEAHYVEKQILGQKGTPFALKLGLGWVIIGEICMGRVHQRNSVRVNKVSILDDGRATCSEPCHNYIHVKEHIETSDYIISDRDFRGNSVFVKTPDDETAGLSVEDRTFLELMNKMYTKDNEDHWTAPLPFREIPDRMPNNRAQALHRAHILHTSLMKDSVKKSQFVTFMQKVIDGGAAEVAPPVKDSKCWYLPLFGVRHPHKPQQIRGVFDSSAVYEGVSLNSMLMSGPDMINSLLGILLRFRRDEVAMTGDIEQMFYRFHVDENHRDFLRFFWYRDNNPDDELIEYRMRSHVFGNSPSPAIATYGLRKTVDNADSDVKDFVYQNFYVDDGLTSQPSESSAISLMKRTQSTMKSEGKLRLHKITSNKQTVMDAFDVSDHGEQLKEIDGDETVHRSLGLYWNLKTDTFVFSIPSTEKPYTRRGLLSTVNSLFDPLGFMAPITISGKILLREATPPGVDWDEPLSPDYYKKWTEWQTSLHSLQDVSIPRMVSHTSVSTAKTVKVYIFSDASEKAIAASAYMKVEDEIGQTSIRFLMGKAKLAPTRGHTIPRLELCGAVLATELAEIVSRQLDISLKSIHYYTDSKVVLGYIGNRTRRFYTYVSNRVDRILRISTADQWSYVSTERNPADSCTRCVTSVVNIMQLPWIIGPQWLCEPPTSTDTDIAVDSPLVDPEKDIEVRPLVTAVSCNSGLGTERFGRFSNWKRLVNAIVVLHRFVRKYKVKHSQSISVNHTYHDESLMAQNFILREVQGEHFADDIQRLRKGQPLANNSVISSLSPYLDTDNVLRVGGRINRAKGQIPSGEINPIVLPKDSHVSKLLIRHFHEQVRHQGRLFTEGALRSGGYWIIGAKRSIASLIYNCVKCRRLRRKLQTQKMSDVPTDRITPGPPFTSVGIDVFGPWQVSTRKTRGGAANSKRWCVLFTCLYTRAIHVEVIEEMSSSSFINALRRFLSIRGPVKVIRSDRGSNFIGASEEMKVNSVKVEDEPVRQFLRDSSITWIFNVPHASHMGGIWERMIGMTRKILDSMLLDSKSKTLTHETLTTFLSEACAIINARPLAPISTDAESPMILSPSVLLTGKVEFLPVVSDSLGVKDIYNAQWKHVQFLADLFWRKWRREYLNLLQTRRKWTHETRNLKVDDVVLMKDSSEVRNNWPMGIIDKVFESEDNLVRKVVVRIICDGKVTFYTRPVQELILLID